MKTPEKILKFYQSTAWKRVRRLKRQLSRGVCEECGRAGWEVHHKTPLTLANIDNPNISMGMDNLELLCTSCHNARREDESQVRSDIDFDSEGNVIEKVKKHPPVEDREFEGTEQRGRSS